MMLSCPLEPTTGSKFARHRKHTHRAAPMMLRVAHAPGSHLGILDKHPLEFESASDWSNDRWACTDGVHNSSSTAIRSHWAGQTPRASMGLSDNFGFFDQV